VTIYPDRIKIRKPQEVIEMNSTELKRLELALFVLYYFVIARDIVFYFFFNFIHIS